MEYPLPLWSRSGCGDVTDHVVEELREGADGDHADHVHEQDQNHNDPPSDLYVIVWGAMNVDGSAQPMRESPLPALAHSILETPKNGGHQDARRG